MSGKFAEKSALVTGAASGIGLAITQQLLKEGARVVGSDINADLLKHIAKELGPRFAPLAGDVTKEADAEALVALAVERGGRLDMAFNVAGGNRAGYIVDQSEEDWSFVVDLCLKSVFLGIKYQGRQMLRQGGGAIVNIASLNAVAATDGLGHYCAAKAGIMQFTQVCAGELGRHGIRANSIGPGTVNTPLGAGFTVGRIGQEFLDRTLVAPPRHQEPSDIADVALFLLSPAAGRITGHFVPVDGGQHVRGLHSYWDVAEAQGLVARP